MIVERVGYVENNLITSKSRTNHRRNEKSKYQKLKFEQKRLL